MTKIPQIPSSKANQTHLPYFAFIDGLRAVAVLSVMVFHAFPNAMPGGFIGVDVFFVISGFLITSIIVEQIEKGTFSFLNFYVRRVQRIFPALVVVLVVCVVVGWLTMTAPDYKRLGLHVQASAGYYSNFILMRESGYFDVLSESKPLLHLWSLAIEEQFYIVWPLMIWGTTKLRIKPTGVVLFLAAAFFFFTMHASHDSANLARLYYSPPSRFWELMVGALLATNVFGELRRIQMHGQSEHPQLLHGTSRFLPDLSALTGAALLISGLAFIDRSAPFPDWHALLPVVGTALIIAGGPSAWINRKILASRLMVWIGLISYPLYLWHWPALSFNNILAESPGGPLIRIGLLVLVVPLAWLTKRVIEQPFRAAGHRLRKAVVLMLMMIAIGFIGHEIFQHNGLASRYGKPDLKIVPGRLECANEAENSGCQFGNPNSEKLIVVTGDSHAEQYTNALRIVLGDRYRFISVTNGSCFMGEKVVHAELGDQKDCNAAKSKLQSLRGQKIYALIRAQRWHGYSVNTPASITAAMNDAMAGYELNPEKIIILGATPDVDFECEMSNYFTRRGNELRECHSNERFKGYVRQFETTARSMETPKNIYFIFPYEIVCPTGECHTLEGSVAIFEDTHHLTTDGAFKVIPYIEAALTSKN